MEKKVITKEISYTVWDREMEQEREYSVSFQVDNKLNKDKKVCIFADGIDINIPIEDIPLLIQALKEFT